MIKNLRCPTCGNKRKRRHQARAYACAPLVGDPHFPLERGDFHLNSIARLRGYYKRSAGGSKELLITRIARRRKFIQPEIPYAKASKQKLHTYFEALWNKAVRTIFPALRKGLQ